MTLLRMRASLCECKNLDDESKSKRQVSAGIQSRHEGSIHLETGTCSCCFSSCFLPLGPVHTGRRSTFACKFACKSFDVVREDILKMKLLFFQQVQLKH